MSHLCAVTAVWLNASQRSRVGLEMNMSARGEVKSALKGPKLQHITTYLSFL